MPGIKDKNRLTSYMTEVTLYRSITGDDAAVNPLLPPDVPALDLSSSPHGLNKIQLFVEPDPGGANPVLEAWVLHENVCYFLGTKTVAADQPEIWLLENVPAASVFIVATTAGNGVVLRSSVSA